jgi:sec-independent protein translocase protein TatB
MFGINAGETIVLVVLAVLVFGPDRLPQAAASAGRLLRQLRQLASGAQEQVRRELGPEFDNFSLTDLNPRSFIAKHLLDGESDAEGSSPTSQQTTSADGPPASPSARRFDGEAT